MIIFNKSKQEFLLFPIYLWPVTWKGKQLNEGSKKKVLRFHIGFKLPY